MTSPAMLSGSESALTDLYDVALLDLDGVVYVGPRAVDHAPESLASARRSGMRLAFVTNNAARTPQAVAAHLTELGVDAEPDEVVTSAQAAAHVLADRLAPGARVLVVGGEGLVAALRDRGLDPVRSADDDPAAVAQGFSPKLAWPDLAEAAVAINRGLLWVATNLDRTVPSARGAVPGNGSMVHTLQFATGRAPDVVTGKPDPTMHLESVESSSAKHPLIVGDRLDTDIEGAVRAGCASLLVLTGVTRAADLLTAPKHCRPTYLGRDLRALLVSQPLVDIVEHQVRCGPWIAQVGASGRHGTGTDGVLLRHARGLPDKGLSGGSGEGLSGLDLGGEGSGEGDLALCALRALAVATWLAVDAEQAGPDRGPSEGQPVRRARGRLTAADDLARAVLARWELPEGELPY